MEKCDYCESELIICTECKRMVCQQCDCAQPKLCYYCDNNDENDCNFVEDDYTMAYGWTCECEDRLDDYED